MKAVVFGGSGFLGGHVADELLTRRYEVIIFDKRPYKYIRHGQCMVVADILDENKVKEVVKDARIFYNFAGIADIDEANEKPLDVIKNNIIGNAVILDAIKTQDVHRYVFASTIYVYSDSGLFYKSSKQSCELFIADYAKKYGIPFTILRYGSLYGPRANHTNPIYRILKEALLENKISYWGNGEEVREYIHVEDAARCSVEILKEDFINQNVILAGHHPIKTKDLLVMISEMLNNKINIELNCQRFDTHYQITPYSFNPKTGRRYISSYYLDLGQGLLQCIEELYNQTGKKEAV